MDKTGRISASRKLLGNPYAYLDSNGEYDASFEDAAIIVGSSTSNISQSMIGKYAALLNKGKKTRSRLPLADIEDLATGLQRKMWRDKDLIWAKPITDPIDALDPSVAIKLLGFGFEMAETLGQHFYGGEQFEVAGTIDSSDKRVRISRQFPAEVRRFTAAHELGHAILHDSQGLHRDRPVNGTKSRRDIRELEADKFASYFLMPGKLVKQIFKQFFLTDIDSFALNEETAFSLNIRSDSELGKTVQTRRGLARFLANAVSYSGRHFKSLAELFGVSEEAMAIRLEELGLQ